jgi:hypothetical protein
VGQLISSASEFDVVCADKECEGFISVMPFDG